MDLFLDGGYGMDKYGLLKENGDMIYKKQISVFAEASLDTEDMPLFEGKRYYIGEEALMEESQNILNVIDYKQHEKTAPLSLWNVLQKENIKKEEINNIYIGLSLAQKEYAPAFIKRMSKFKVNGETFDFTGKIKLIPQGVGAKYAIDHFYYNENHKETYAIIDIGQLTVDVANVISGKIRSENAQGSEHEGVIKIIQQIQEYIAREFSEVISIKEAQEVMLTGKYNLFGVHDLSSVIDKFKEDYSVYVINMLKQRHRNIFKKYPKIYIVGGGSYYISKETLKKSEGISFDTIVFPEDAEYYNVIGSMVFSKLNRG